MILLRERRWPWPGGPGGLGAIPTGRGGCGFSPGSGRAQESSNECAGKWSNNSLSLQSTGFKRRRLRCFTHSHSPSIFPRCLCSRIGLHLASLGCICPGAVGRAALRPPPPRAAPAPLSREDRVAGAQARRGRPRPVQSRPSPLLCHLRLLISCRAHTTKCLCHSLKAKPIKPIEVFQIPNKP